MEAAKLDLAFAWTCPKCSTRNYLDGVPAELSMDELDFVVEELDIENRQSLPGRLMTIPDTVRCDVCDEEYLSIEDEDD